MAENNNTAAPEKVITGYRIAIAALAVILVGVSLLYFNINRQQKAEYAVLNTERNSIQENLTDLIGEFDQLKTSNDQLKLTLEIERHRADSIITSLKKERTLNYSKIRKYEGELSSLRKAMTEYLAQIDSLNTLNQALMTENVNIQNQLSETELRAQEAEKLAAELDSQVRKGALLIAQSIELAPLNKKGREISRVKRAKELSVNFNIAANKLAKAGNKEIYARIISPDGYVLTTEAMPTFQLDGKATSYSASREISYQNQDLPVSIFFAGEGFVAGTYEVELYADGAMIGSEKLEKR